jgi:hypothetical protein
MSSADILGPMDGAVLLAGSRFYLWVGGSWTVIPQATDAPSRIKCRYAAREIARLGVITFDTPQTLPPEKVHSQPDAVVQDGLIYAPSPRGWYCRERYEQRREEQLRVATLRREGEFVLEYFGGMLPGGGQAVAEAFARTTR